jgi:hypothetical protein
MEWLVLVLGLMYFAVGLGVLVWHIRGSALIDSDQKKTALKTLVLIPEVCLFWPIILFLELKSRRAVRNTNNPHVD